MSMELMVKALKLKIGNQGRKLVLVKLADNASDQGECWPSYQYIADICEMSKRSAMSHVKKLEDMGLLRRETRIGKTGQSSNLYHLTLDNGEMITRGGYKSSPKEKVIHKMGMEIPTNSQGGTKNPPHQQPRWYQKSTPPSATVAPPGENISLGGSEMVSPRISHSLEPVNESVIDQGFSKNNGKTIQGFSEQVGETEIFDTDILKVWEYVKKSTAMHYPTRRPPNLPDQQDADAIEWLLEESKEFLDERFCTAFCEVIIGEHGKSKIYNPFIRAKMMTEKNPKGRDTWVDEIYVHMEGLDLKWGEETGNSKLQMAIDSLAYLNSQKSELFEKLNLRATEFVNNPTNLKPIKLIIKAGYTLDQIQLVIEHSVERLGSSPIYRNYITPSSIFNPDKFEEKLTIAKDWKNNGKQKLNPKAANDPNWDDTSWGDNIDWSM
ncbi:helix-turn-helix domain-containing protein [Vibrio alginolyticus]|uniref:helix-turn-helix domain-containing protein n=1 Tax=Vibrio alginolyticus TaxID=663 RepID=UPI002119EA18|nr:helix-turn-helix domain-containing protein [Vibrio alginolyticus]MCQ9090558.1 helix-turn-helix domain-containing protein [Vibrio alginolyticus]